jgi:hypothetical protein
VLRGFVMSRSIAVLWTTALASAGASASERAKSPADSTVFIRMVGNVHVEIEEFGVKRMADRERVESGPRRMAGRAGSAAALRATASRKRRHLRISSA